jgi:TetR/AcrR family transcriptional regulator, transcriptional repressor of aconitase
MPRVSPEHRAAQRQRILDAARRCFVRDGFHATSIQDILAEAELSAGGVYVYFKSKEEIVEAIAGETVAIIVGALSGLLDAGDLPALDVAVGRALSRLVAHDRAQPTFRLAVQAWGEVGRSPRLAALVAKAQGEVRQVITHLMLRYQARGDLVTDVPPEQIAQVVIALVAGFVVQSALLGIDDVPSFQAGFRAMLAPHLRSGLGRP